MKTGIFTCFVCLYPAHVGSEYKMSNEQIYKKFRVCRRGSCLPYLKLEVPTKGIIPKLKLVTYLRVSTVQKGK